MTEEKLTAVQNNIYSHAHWAVGGWDTFDWHKYRGVVDADVLWSSQALCISVWGSVASEDGATVRAAVADVIEDDAFHEALRAGVPALSLEMADRSLLNERGTPNPSCLDAVLTFERLIVVIESKLSESLGTCSQHPKNCTGVYGPGSDRKCGTNAACRLEVQDGRRTPRLYWSVMKSLCDDGLVVPAGSRCPFKGEGYQAMRNIAAGRQLSLRHGLPWRTVFAAPVSTSRTSIQAARGVQGLLSTQHRHAVVVLDYDKLATRLCEDGDAVARNLGIHLQARLDAARTK